jgi:hypothetical protein
MPASDEREDDRGGEVLEGALWGNIREGDNKPEIDYMEPVSTSPDALQIPSAMVANERSTVNYTLMLFADIGSERGPQECQRQNR